MVASCSAWRRELAKWQQGYLSPAESTSENSGLQALTAATNATATIVATRKPWLPLPLSKLFGGKTKPTDTNTPPRRTYTEEAMYMEILAAEMNDPDDRLDDGALEGSGYEYDPTDV